MEGKNKNKQKKGQKAVTSSFAGLRRVHRGHRAPSAGSVPCPLSAPRAPEVRAPGRAALSARRHPEPPMLARLTPPPTSGFPFTAGGARTYF